MKIGQRLYVVMGKYKEYMPVTKIGRKWVTLGEGLQHVRIDKDTMKIDGAGYSSPGQAHLSKADYEEYCLRNTLWGDLQAHVRKFVLCPAYIPTEELESIVRTLKKEKP